MVTRPTISKEKRDAFKAKMESVDEWNTKSTTDREIAVKEELNAILSDWSDEQKELWELKAYKAGPQIKPVAASKLKPKPKAEVKSDAGPVESDVVEKLIARLKMSDPTIIAKILEAMK